MDLTKIGKYIAGKRKELGLTQKQLAEKLNMSDKSVSKWERGICLPDVSVYSELSQILGISINEFFAGEDISQENIFRKSEENLIGVATDSKKKQSKMKLMIYGLLAISILAVSVIGITLYRENKPQNDMIPIDRDSIEMKTAELFSESGDAHIYKFRTTDEYRYLRLYVSEYHSGKLINSGTIMELGFTNIGSPENGEILIVSDFENYEIKLVVAADGYKGSTEVAILEGVADRAYYGRSATEIQESTAIEYDKEQALVAFIYDNDEMSVLDICDFLDGLTDSLAENDYVYCFSFEFCKN